MDKRAIFYIASRKYINEAFISANTAKKQMPDIDIFLFVTELWLTDIRPEYIIEIRALGNQQHEHWYLDSTRYMYEALKYLEAEGYRHVLYLDTDTYVISPVYDLFTLTKIFDFAGSHAPGRRTTNHVEIPGEIQPIVFSDEVFPEFNIGVNPMYVPSMVDVWGSCYEGYKKYENVYGNNEQGVFRDMAISYLQVDTFRFYVLPPEYNCRFNFPCFIKGDVKILHGRSDNFPELIQNINAEKGMRVWVNGRLFI